jgi:transcriptional regulator with XRE-family HTH domain
VNELVAEESRLFEAVSRSFADAVRRAMRVAGEGEEGGLGSLTQTDLAAQADMGRSTLAKYLGTGPEDPVPNPTLDVVCRLADALGVPPAFLLMRPKDWASLATGTLTFLQALPARQFGERISELQAMKTTNSLEVANKAIELGLLLNTVEDDQDKNLPTEVREFRHAAKVSTAAIAASIPFRYDGVSKEHLPVLLTLCGIVGTTTARN